MILLHLDFLDTIVEQCLNQNGTLLSTIERRSHRMIKEQRINYEKIIESNNQIINQISKEIQKYHFTEIMGFYHLEYINK